MSIIALAFLSPPTLVHAADYAATHEVDDDHTADEAAIRTQLADLEAGWRDTNGSAVAATFTEDADFIVGDGTHLMGRSAIVSYLQTAVDNIMPGGYPVTHMKSLRFVSEKVPIMHTEGGILLPGETRVPADRLGVQTFVAVKHEGGWLFRTYQNTRIVQYPR